MTIYIDIIFLENLFMNFIIIFASSVILKIPIKITRALISSIIGSAYAIIVYISDLKIYSNFILKIALSVCMVYIAFESKTLKLLLKHMLIFYLTSFTFGGVAFALLYLINPKKILMQDGVLIGTYPIKIIIAGGIVGFIIITYSFKNIKGKFNKKDMLCNIQIEIDNKSTYIKGILDTGNFLKDPISKAPVIVVEKQKLINIVPIYILDNLEKIIKGEDINLGEYISKIRLIPFSSLGKENGILIGIKASNVKIENEENVFYINDVIRGIYNGIIGKNGKYHALIGLEMLDNNYSYENTLEKV